MPPRPGQEAIRRVALDAALLRLDALEVALGRMSKGAPGKRKVHRIRVCCRRLLSALGVLAAVAGDDPKLARWIGRVDRLMRRFGDVRDFDVQLATLEKAARRAPSEHRNDLRRLNDWLAEQRQAAAKKLRLLRRDFDAARVRKARESFVKLRESTADSPRGAQAWAAAAGVLRVTFREVRGLERRALQSDSADELHAMRIALKGFRYSLELLASFHPHAAKKELRALEAIQDELGELHDASVWPEVVARYLRKQNKLGGSATPLGLDWFLLDRRQKRARLFDNFVGQWRSRKGRRLLAKLVISSRRG